MPASMKCPQCGLVQMARPTCKSCGAPLADPAPMPGPSPIQVATPVTPSPVPGESPPKRNSKTRIQEYLGLGLVGLGLLLSVVAFVFTDEVGPLRLLGGMGACGIGLAFYANAKGRSVAWCAAVLFPILGPLLALLVLSRQAQSAPRHRQLAELSIVSWLPFYGIFGGGMFGDINASAAFYLMGALGLAAALLAHVALFLITRRPRKSAGWGLVYVALGITYLHLPFFVSVCAHVLAKWSAR